MTRRGKWVAASLLEREKTTLEVAWYRVEDGKLSLENRKEVKRCSSSVLVIADGNTIKISAGTEVAEFQIPVGLPERGSIGFDRGIFAGPLLISDIELWSPEAAAQPETMWPGTAYEFPKSLTAFDSRWIFNVSADDVAGHSIVNCAISGGPAERERPPTFSGRMPNEELVNPYLKIVTPDGVVGDKSYIYLGRIGLKENWDRNQPYLPPADIECPVRREFVFDRLPGGCKLIVGYERHWQEDHMQHPVAGAEMLIEPKTGEPLFAGRPIASGEVAVTVDSGSGKRICGMVPKDVFQYEEALAFAAGNHYFFESEDCRFTITLRYRESEISSWELSLFAQLEDAFHTPMGDPRKLKLGEAMACAIPGEFSVNASIGLGKLPVGVYHLALRVEACGGTLRAEKVAFESIGDSLDAPCPPMASGLPELFSLHADNASSTDHFDPWSAAGVGMSHYYSVSTFQPLLAIKSKPWELLNLYRRKWLLWLATNRTLVKSDDPRENRELVEHADYCTRTGSGGRLLIAALASYTEEVRRQLKRFLKLNKIADGPLSAEEFDVEKPVDAEMLERLLVNHGCAWIEFLCQWRDEGAIKARTALYKGVNPDLRLMCYGFYATYVACLKGAFHCLAAGWDIRKHPESHYDAFAIFEDYPYLCGYPIQRTIYMLAATKLEAPEIRLCPEVYSIKAVPVDVATTYGSPPYGKNLTEVFAKRFYEYAYGSVWFREGKFNYWNDKIFHFSNIKPEEMEEFLTAWKNIRGARPAKPVRTVAYVTGITCCLRHRESVRRMISENKEELDLFNTAEEFPAFVHEATRLSGQPAGFVTRPEDLSGLSAADAHTLVLPPLSTFTDEEREAVRRLHSEGVSLLCSEDVTGLEDVFGVELAEPIRVVRLEGFGMAETTNDPECVSKYGLSGAEALVWGDSEAGRKTPVLTLRESGGVFAALYTVPPTVVRKMEVGHKHCNGGRSSVSELINQSAVEIMEKIGKPSVRVSEGRLIAFYDSEGGMRIIVSEDAHPAPAVPINPLVSVGCATGKSAVFSDHAFSSFVDPEGGLSLRLHLKENEATMLRVCL